MRSSFFWDVTKRILLLTDISVRPICHIFKDQTHQEDFLGVLNLEDGADTSCRNSRHLTADLRCLTSQNSEYLTFFVIVFAIIFPTQVTFLL